jgi:hypothetical protein
MGHPVRRIVRLKFLRGGIFKAKYFRMALRGVGGALVAAVAWKLGEDIYDGVKKRLAEPESPVEE